MGNYLSCSLGKNSLSAKVILPDGEIRHIHAPTKAAELMMQIPNHFLVEAKSLKIGRKFSPLGADDDLSLGGRHVYVAFPMARATSAANASDMARLFLTAKKRGVQRGRFGGKNYHTVRISPSSGASGVEVSDERDDIRLIPAGPKLNLEDIDEFSSSDFMHRISVSRSKKPLLETIEEEPISSK